MAFLVSLPALLTALFQAFKEFCTWKARESEINARKLVQTELERKQKENQDLEKQINTLRAGSSADNEYADRLRQQSLANTSYLKTLPTWVLDPGPAQASADDRGGIHTTGAGNVGSNAQVSNSGTATS